MTLDGFPRAPIFILGHKWQRLAQPFLQWQYQRPVLLYQNLRETDTVDSWLEFWGGREAMNPPLSNMWSINSRIPARRASRKPRMNCRRVCSGFGNSCRGKLCGVCTVIFGSTPCIHASRTLVNRSNTGPNFTYLCIVLALLHIRAVMMTY